MLISVIIPAYNVEKYIEKCLDNLISFRHDDYEIIVVNDGSHDGTRNILDRYASEYSNVYVVNQDNSGVSAARNRGIEEARGKYITFVDADDIITSDMFDIMVENAKLDIYDFIYGDYETIDENDNIYEYMRAYSDPGEDMAKMRKLYIDATDLNTCWGKLYRLDIIRRNKILFDSTMKIGEDMVFVGRYILCIDSFRYIGASMYRYRILETGAMGASRYRIDSQKINDFVKGLRFREEFAIKCGLDREDFYIEYASETIAMINIMLKGKRKYKTEYMEAKNLLDNETIKDNLKRVLKYDKLSIKRKLVCATLVNRTGRYIYTTLKHFTYGRR